MMYKALNRRRKRRLEGKELLTDKPFCYVVYSKRYVKPVYSTRGWLKNYEIDHIELNRPFASYGGAIAHLTRVKLAIDEEDKEWARYTPCKIVEGVYTKSGKEHIIKEVRLNNECDRPPERHFSSGLPRQQRRTNIPVPKVVGNPYRTKASGGGWYTNPYVDTSTVRSSGATTSCSTATGVVAKWDELPFSALI